MIILRKTQYYSTFTCLRIMRIRKYQITTSNNVKIIENFLTKHLFYILPMSGILIKTEIKLKYVHMFQVIKVSEKEWRYHLNLIMRHGPKEVRIICQL